MSRTVSWILRFLHGLAANTLSSAGVVITTSSFLAFVFLEILRLAGLITNAYLGLVTYLALPALFILGLLLIPLGWWLLGRRTPAAGKIEERFGRDATEPGRLGSKLFLTIAAFTLLNLLFLGAGSVRMLGFMDEPVFCGTACHSVMNPEWTAYQSSPHARVRCVDCHVGQGPEAALDAKLNGIWQMISVTFDLYERPIPTPVHNLRPARETCEQCHWPEAFYGDRIKRIVHYSMDRDSTPRYTTLSLKVGPGKFGPGKTNDGRDSKQGHIHWHVASGNLVRYEPGDPSRLSVRWVEVRRADGTFERYTNRRLSSVHGHGLEVRVMDCVDCHNRATHIYEGPEDAVDRLIREGAINRKVLPFAKRQALAALTGEYAPGDAATGIDLDFRAYYRGNQPGTAAASDTVIDKAVSALQSVYTRNVHENMNVTWNAYPNHLGHRNGPGCFRCHSEYLVNKQGRAMPHDCTLCHSMLAYDSNDPFEFLSPPDPESPDCKMHLYLNQEFTGHARGSSRDPCPMSRKASNTGGK
ncbi:MAG: cytochrome C [Deltaproteobacteria bacterium]|nr:cytochrome C [Deltaproteobacteria bacterium]